MLVRFILLTVLAYFIFRWLDRFFRPKPEANPVKKKKSAKTDVIHQKGQTKSVVKDEVGEYVDFEEIKKEK